MDHMSSSISFNPALATSASLLPAVSSRPAVGNVSFSSFSFKDIGRQPSLLLRLGDRAPTSSPLPSPAVPAKQHEKGGNAESSRPSLFQRLSLDVSAPEIAAERTSPPSHTNDSSVVLPLSTTLFPSKVIESPSKDLSVGSNSGISNGVINQLPLVAASATTIPAEIQVDNAATTYETENMTNLQPGHTPLASDYRPLLLPNTVEFIEPYTLDTWCRTQVLDPLKKLMEEVQMQQAEWDEVRVMRDRRRQQEEAFFTHLPAEVVPDLMETEITHSSHFQCAAYNTADVASQDTSPPVCFASASGDAKALHSPKPDALTPAMERPTETNTNNNTAPQLSEQAATACASSSQDAMAIRSTKADKEIVSMQTTERRISPNNSPIKRRRLSDNIEAEVSTSQPGLSASMEADDKAHSQATLTSEQATDVLRNPAKESSATSKTSTASAIKPSPPSERHQAIDNPSKALSTEAPQASPLSGAPHMLNAFMPAVTSAGKFHSTILPMSTSSTQPYTPKQDINASKSPEKSVQDVPLANIPHSPTNTASPGKSLLRQADLGDRSEIRSNTSLNASSPPSVASVKRKRSASVHAAHRTPSPPGLKMATTSTGKLKTEEQEEYITPVKKLRKDHECSDKASIKKEPIVPQVALPKSEESASKAANANDIPSSANIIGTLPACSQTSAETTQDPFPKDKSPTIPPKTAVVVKDTTVQRNNVVLQQSTVSMGPSDAGWTYDTPRREHEASPFSDNRAEYSVSMEVDFVPHTYSPPPAGDGYLRNSNRRDMAPVSSTNYRQPVPAVDHWSPGQDMERWSEQGQRGYRGLDTRGTVRTDTYVPSYASANLPPRPVSPLRRYSPDLSRRFSPPSPPLYRPARTLPQSQRPAITRADSSYRYSPERDDNRNTTRAPTSDLNYRSSHHTDSYERPLSTTYNPPVDRQADSSRRPSAPVLLARFEGVNEEAPSYNSSQRRTTPDRDYNYRDETYRASRGRTNTRQASRPYNIDNRHTVDNKQRRSALADRIGDPEYTAYTSASPPRRNTNQTGYSNKHQPINKHRGGGDPNSPSLASRLSDVSRRRSPMTSLEARFS